MDLESIRPGLSRSCVQQDWRNRPQAVEGQQASWTGTKQFFVCLLQAARPPLRGLSPISRVTPMGVGPSQSTAAPQEVPGGAVAPHPSCPDRPSLPYFTAGHQGTSPGRGWGGKAVPCGPAAVGAPPARPNPPHPGHSPFRHRQAQTSAQAGVLWATTASQHSGAPPVVDGSTTRPGEEVAGCHQGPTASGSQHATTKRSAPLGSAARA
ncbi:hypothetical protein NDU88_002040 [Pleurodeles waltl]|uniref:Uncharacterized protein n=1 Tax=Pleurodeles waltl TaxID=8319 RepID=A0AAV7UWG4_PLEWA|nr:hypothetical protein NDU88_002040 [Pleurodeles waltl]